MNSNRSTVGTYLRACAKMEIKSGRTREQFVAQFKAEKQELAGKCYDEARATVSNRAEVR